VDHFFEELLPFAKGDTLHGSEGKLGTVHSFNCTEALTHGWMIVATTVMANRTVKLLNVICRKPASKNELNSIFQKMSYIISSRARCKYDCVKSFFSETFQGIFL
jgi:hypothetical protein